MGLKRKVIPESEKEKTSHGSDSASDIQQKTDKAAEQILPQRKTQMKNTTPRINRIFNTSSSIAISSEKKISDTLLNPSDSVPQSVPPSISISFGEEFSIPKTPVNYAAVPLPDTELYTDDEDEDEDVDEKKLTEESIESTESKKKPASDTIIGFTDDKVESRIDMQNDDDDEEEEVIPVLDSDEESEQFINVAPPDRSKNFFNCSKSVSGTSSLQNLDNFFNNPPSVSDLQLVVRHSDIQRSKMKQQVQQQHQPVIEENENADSESEDEQERDLEHVEIGPTDEEDNLIDLTIDDSPQQQRPQRSSEIVLSTNTPRGVSAQISKTTTPRSGKKNITNINIKLDLKICIRHGSCSDSDTSSDKSSPQILTESQTPTSSHSKNKSARMEKFAAGGQQMTPVLNEIEKTPKKVEPIIDEGLESLLNELYGETWKTPQLLKSCKSKRVREDLRKSIHANNFDSFVRNLPPDVLESTRLVPSGRKNSAKKPNFKIPTAPVSSTKKESLNKKNTARSDSESDVQQTPPKSIPKSAKKETPRYMEVCDPDTTSSEESNSDDDFNPNDSWNASSDEEYKNENERIQKRLTIRQSIHRHDEELTFTRDESLEEQEKLEELLKKYEYKPPQIDEVKKISRRKLFTHTVYEEEEEIVLEEKENEIPKGFKWPTPVKKDIKKPITPTVQKTPTAAKIKSTPKSSAAKRFGPLSFLKSLDAEANRSLCDADALLYRNNYKSKKIDLAIKLFKLYNEKVFDSKLTEVPIKWNKKLLNTAGRCHNSRKNGVKQSSLELSDKVLTSADRLRCTLIHEMCHAATWVLNGENGHGVIWKRWAAKANSTFPELPKITVCHDYAIEYKYTYLCINCKAQSKTHSKSRKVDEIQCSICKGKIKLFENKKNASGVIEMIPVEKKELKGNYKLFLIKIILFYFIFLILGFAKFVQLKFKEVKQPQMTHKEVMQILSAQFSSLSVAEKANL